MSDGKADKTVLRTVLSETRPELGEGWIAGPDKFQQAVANKSGQEVSAPRKILCWLSLEFVPESCQYRTHAILAVSDRGKFLKNTSSNGAAPDWASRPVSLAAANDSASNSASYYESDRAEMIAFLPPDPKRLLDIGCGEGLFGQAVKKRFPMCETWGIELVAKAAEKAASRNDHVINVPLEDSNLPAEYFDVVTMNDVLEHIIWPSSTLQGVKRVLKPDGKLVISLPNVQFLLNVLNLVIRNDWQYQDSGILDHTHMRFYTTKSAARLVEDAGFQVEKIVGINPMRPKWYYRVLFAMAPRYFRWMPFYQFAIVARPRK